MSVSVFCGIYVDPQIDTNSIRKRGFPIWEYSSLPAHFRTGTPHMEMGSVFLATSKSRIEEYHPPNFGQEIKIFPLSCDCDTLKALRVPIIRSIALIIIVACSRLGIALIPAHRCFHLGIFSVPVPWSLLALSQLHESLLRRNSPRGGFSHSYNRQIHPRGNATS